MMAPASPEASEYLRQFLREHEVVFVSVGLASLGILVFRNWLKGGRCRSEATLHGKTVIITGANAGIGKETAKDLTRRGARVVMACRNLAKAEEAVADIKARCPSGDIVIRFLDLSSFDSIRRFANEVLHAEPRIDILINNAGVLTPKSKTKDGFDMTFGTNHLGHFLLTNLLLDRLKQSAPARIVTLSSRSHKVVSSMNWQDLNLDLPNAYSAVRAYGQSKLANILFTKELARRLLGTGVTTYSVHPGFVNTGFDRHVFQQRSILRKASFWVRLLFAKTVEEGAQTTVYCAVDEHIQNKSGYYYKDCRECTPSPAACDPEAARRLWDESLKMVGLESDVHQPFRKK